MRASRRVRPVLPLAWLGWAVATRGDARLTGLSLRTLPHHAPPCLPDLDRTLAALSSVTEQSASSRSTSSRLLSPPTSLSGPPSELASFLSALDGVLARSADLRSAGLAGAQAELTTNAALADRAFASLCRLAAGAVREGTPASPPDFRTAAARARTGEERQVDEQAILPTAETLRASGVVAYLASCALVGSPAGRKEWDGVWRVWSALRGEWLRSGVALSPSLSSAAADEHAGSPTAADPTSQLLVGYLAHASAERALLLSLFPSSHPPAATLLPQLLAPSLTAVQALLQAHVQQLKRVAFPWRAYALSSTLSSLAPSWAAFFHNPPSAGGAQGADLLLAVDPGPAQSQLAKSLRGVCLRSVPEAVERAKVPGPRAGEQPAVGVSPTVTEVRPPPLPSPLAPLEPRRLTLPSHPVRPPQTVAYLLALPAHAHTLTGFLTALGDRKWLMGAAPVPLERDAGEPDLLEHFVCASPILGPFPPLPLVALVGAGLGTLSLGQRLTPPPPFSRLPPRRTNRRRRRRPRLVARRPRARAPARRRRRLPRQQQCVSPPARCLAGADRRARRSPRR